MLFTIGTFVSGAISWKCFGGFHWNLVRVYICIRGWCTPNGIVHHLLKTELWPFIFWKNAFYYRHFCVRSHILEVLWRISLKLGMSIYPPPEQRDIVLALSVRPSGTFFVRSHVLEVLWRISLNLVWVYIWIRGWCTPNGIRPSVRHFCVRSHILEVLWWISLKLGMSIYMDKRMMHAKWHCTPSL